MTDIQYRNNVHYHGDGPDTLVLAHGFGCDQTMWRLLHPTLARHWRVVLLDLVGSGRSDLSAYDREKYGSLHGHADDLLEIVERYAVGRVVLVGHSVSAMIGMLATIKAPQRFAAQIMVGPSPCFINDDDYVGGYNREDIDGLLAFMEQNYLAWTRQMAPVIMGAPDRPALSAELQQSFAHTNHDIAKHFARVTFTADHRADVAQSTVPALILQCSDDLIAPREVGEYLHAHLAHSELDVIDNIGHCPHLSAPTASSAIIGRYLAKVL